MKDASVCNLLFMQRIENVVVTSHNFVFRQFLLDIISPCVKDLFRIVYGQVRRVLVGPPSNLNPQLAWHKLGAMVKTGFSVLVPSFCVETCLWPSSSAGAGPWLDGTGHRCQDWALGTLALGSATNPPRLPTSNQDLRVHIHKDWFKTAQFEPFLDPYCLLGMSQFTDYAVFFNIVQNTFDPPPASFSF